MKGGVGIFHRLRSFIDRLRGRHRRHEIIEIEGPHGLPALLIRFPLEESRRLRDLDAATDSFVGTHASLAPSIIDQLAAASPFVATGLRGGYVFEVVGPSPLVTGIEAGTHEIMQVSGALSGTVTSHGRIAGQLRFHPVSRVRLHAPLALWTTLHVVAGTVQLRDISAHLADLARQIGRLVTLIEAERIGRLDWAFEALQDLFGEFRTRRAVTPGMLARLAVVERDVGVVLKEKARFLESYEADLRRVTNQEGKAGAQQALRGLAERDDLALDLWVKATSLDLQIEELRILDALETCGPEAQRRVDRLRDKVGRYQRFLERLTGLEEEAAAHARKCVDQMRWWQRTVTQRSLVGDLESAAGAAQLSESREAEGSARPATCLFWQSPDGEIHARIMLPPASARGAQGY